MLEDWSTVLLNRMARIAMKPWNLIFLTGLSLSCAAQQSSAPANPPAAPAAAAKDSKAPAASSTPAPTPRSLEEGRATLRDAETAHPGNTPEVAEALFALMYDETLAGAINDDTMAVVERALKVAEAAKGKESHLYAQGLSAKAYLLMLMDRPELSRPLAEQAVAIEQRIGTNPAGLADAEETLIYACDRGGDDQCAERAADSQVKTLRSIKDVDPGQLAKALNSLMWARQMNNRMAEAKQAEDEAMAIAERAETLSPDWAILENNAGGFYMAHGDYQLALDHLKKSLQIDEKLKTPAGAAQGAVMGNLAFVDMRLGNTAEALQYYARARELFAQRFGSQHTQTTLVDVGYGYALSFLGRYQEAVDLELGAHRLQRERIRLAIQLMPEQQALAMASTSAMSFDAAVTLAAGHPDIAGAPVYQEIVRSRALVADEMAKRQAVINRKLDPELQTLQDELQKDARAVMDLQGAPASDNGTKALADAAQQMEQTERKLAEKSAAVRADERAESADLSDLRKNMPPGSVLVSYVAYSKYSEDSTDNFNKPAVPSYIAFVLHRDSEHIGVYDLGAGPPTKDLILKMRDSADAEAHGGGLGSARNERAYREAGLELRKRIWDPIQSELQNATLVLVVPDGSLNLVPFSALPSGNGYLVEHGPVIHILSSERDLLPTQRADKKAGLLAIGSPSFESMQATAASNPPASNLRGGPIKCEAFTQMEFHPLPGSLSEVKEISSTFKRWNAAEPEQMLTGEDATLARFLVAAPQSRILHIATHAFLLDRSCGNGNPLMHSGLVFAGANKTRNDSILTAQQIASIDLKGVDWAVLSACDTGGGELKDGEGVLGLERAFRVAGANSVIMALWPIDDQVTREFMRNLYDQRFAHRATTADAVWTAARKLLKDRQAAGKSTHPWYWAGFVGSGGWE